MDEAEIIRLIRHDFLAKTKMHSIATDWATDGRRLHMSLPLILNPGVFNGTGRVAFRATPNQPDRDVSATLIATVGGQDLRVSRIDWRPRAPHVNRVGPEDLRGEVRGSQFHGFDENIVLGLKEMLARNLPVCVLLEPDPANFKELLTVIGAKFNIAIVPDQIAEPQWSELLL